MPHTEVEKNSKKTMKTPVSGMVVSRIANLPVLSLHKPHNHQVSHGPNHQQHPSLNPLRTFVSHQAKFFV